jgi:hypothetical protein
MKRIFEKPNFTATAMSFVPYRDIPRGVDAVLRNFPEAPCLPVMTRSIRWMLEGMPCLVFDREKRQIRLDLSPEREGELLEFYDRYEANDLDYFTVRPETAPFLYAMIDTLSRKRPPDLKWVVFHTAGPLILGDTIRMLDGNPSMNNETLRDMLIKATNIKARWLEKKIKEEVPGVEVVADLPETNLVNFTSAGGTGSREEILAAINGSFEGMDCLTWIHCCANVDWSLLTQTNTDVINFDAYQHADKAALYAGDFKRFLERGGMIGWGIIPVSGELLEKESLESLLDRLQKGFDLFVRSGIDEGLLASSSWILPSCETVLLTPEQSDRAFELAREISLTMKARYGFAG